MHRTEDELTIAGLKAATPIQFLQCDNKHGSERISPRRWTACARPGSLSCTPADSVPLSSSPCSPSPHDHTP